MGGREWHTSVETFYTGAENQRGILTRTICDRSSSSRVGITAQCSTAMVEASDELRRASWSDVSRGGGGKGGGRIAGWLAG
jgi:hypothetical protein